jgi:hypothetical protein
MPRKIIRSKKERGGRAGRRSQRALERRQPRPIKQRRQRQIAVTKTPPGTVGWLAPVIDRLARDRRWALSLNKNNQLVVSDGYPLELMAASPSDIVSNARIATAGQTKKVQAQAVWPAVAADTSLTLTGTTVFGVRIRITNSIQNFKFGTYNVQVLNGATIIADFNVQANQLPVDIIVLTISSGNGKASIVGVTNPIVKFLAATNPALVSGDVLYAESLNARDLGDLTNLAQCCPPGTAPASDSDQDVVYVDENDENDENDEDAEDRMYDQQ